MCFVAVERRRETLVVTDGITSAGHRIVTQCVTIYLGGDGKELYDNCWKTAPI